MAGWFHCSSTDHTCSKLSREKDSACSKLRRVEETVPSAVLSMVDPCVFNPAVGSLCSSACTYHHAWHARDNGMQLPVRAHEACHTPPPPLVVCSEANDCCAYNCSLCGCACPSRSEILIPCNYSVTLGVGLWGVSWECDYRV